MSRHRFRWCLGLALFFTSPLSAEVRVTLKADKNVVAIGDPLGIQIEVSGVKNAKAPTIKGLDDFDIESNGSSSKFEMINGVVSSSVTFNFSLYAKNHGTYTLGPASVSASGTITESSTITVRVLNTEEKPPEEKYYFVEASVDETSPYLNQQLIYSFKFFTRASIADARLSLPEFPDFWEEENAKQKKEYVKVVDGIEWNVTEIHTILFPSRPGVINIPEARLELSVVMQENRRRRSIFEGFMMGGGVETRRVHLRTPPISINVSPLPETGKPDNFLPLVGNFTLESSLSKKQLEVGESATLTIILSGPGNVRDAIINEQWQKVKSYKDTPTIDVRLIDGRIEGVKTFKIALVPLEPGKLDLQPLVVDYFDPWKKSYQKAISNHLDIEVLPSSEKEKLSHVGGNIATSAKREVKIVGTDLMPIKSSIDYFGGQEPTPSEKILALASAPLSLFGYFFALFTYNRQNKIAADTGYSRRERAYRTYKQRYKGITSQEKYHLELSTLLRNYLGDKFDIDGKSLTPIDTSRHLAPRNIKTNTIDEINQLLTACDSASYGGLTISETSKMKLANDLESIVRKIEKEAKK